MKTSKIFDSRTFSVERHADSMISYLLMNGDPHTKASGHIDLLKSYLAVGASQKDSSVL